MRIPLWVFLVSLLVAMPARAQETRGNISGTVRDAQSAPLPGATVKITSVDTGANQQLITNGRGYFEAPLLQPGNYQITVEMPGFKGLTRKGIVLSVGQQLSMTLPLDIGSVSENVTVTAEAPLLDTSSVSSGQNFDQKLLESLPMFSNMAIMVTRFAAGVNPSDNQGLVSQGFVDGTTQAAGGAIGGVGSNTYTIDGATNGGSGRRIASSPNSDMIQEMRVESSNFDASVGHGTGLQISMMTKAGTNAVHGTAGYQYWTNKFNELNAQQKATFSAKAKEEFEKGRSHNGAFTLGGPLVIPKVVDGRGKLFFFANYSPVNDYIPGKNQGSLTIPANQAHLNGDFSDLLKLPNPAQYQIYDPLTARPDPTNAARTIRSPFPNNVIPRDRIFNPDGTYKNSLFGLYAGMVPAPNQNFLSATQAPVSNYYRGGEPDKPVSNLVGVRLDYNVNSNNRLFFRGSGSRFLEGVSDWTYETPRAGLHSIDRSRYTWSYTGNWTHTQGATVIDSQFATNRFFQTDLNKELSKYSPTSVGLPGYMDAFCAAKGSCMLPRVSISGYQGISNGSSDADTATNIQGQVNITTLRGPHTWRSGIDVRQAQRKRSGGGSTSGVINFTREFTRQASDETNLTANNIGLALAAFMLGVPGGNTSAGASVDDNSPANFRNHFFGAFAEDSWRVGSNLTVNAGLRFEYEDGISEDQKRMLVGFDENAQLAISSLAEAAYAKNPIPQLPASQFKVRGGGIYATDPGQDGKSWKGEGMWMPRFSSAYKLGEKTVLKGGWGLYYDTLNAADYDADQLGYNVTTNSTATNDSGRTFRMSIADPFPVRSDGTRFDTPIGAGLGADVVAGTGYSAQNLNRQHSRQQRWRFGVQRQLGPRMVVDVAYNGSFADRVSRTIKQDYLPEEYWNGNTVRDITQQTLLNGQVPNPYNINNFAALKTSDPVLYQRMSANGFFTNLNVARNRLLRPFSQINGLNYSDLPLGKVKSHALEITLSHRYSRGFSANGSFSASRTTENRTVEEYERAPTIWQTSNNARPYRITASAVYELPFGSGKPLLANRKIISAIVGGWQTAGTFEYQPGAALNWGNVFFYGDFKNIAKKNPEIALQADGVLDKTKTWFNIDAGFEKDPTKTPAAFQKRTFPFRLSDVRSQVLTMVNMNIARNFNLGKRRTLQARMDVQNLLNRQQYGGPNLDPTSTNFGLVTNVNANSMRFFTFVTRFSF
ncbi:MAG: carboxypeptidase-like regulatory domain-containing protein [Vicinamibacterales bacterium]